MVLAVLLSEESTSGKQDIGVAIQYFCGQSLHQKSRNYRSRSAIRKAGNRGEVIFFGNREYIPTS
jgi:hypothetical protein